MSANTESRSIFVTICLCTAKTFDKAPGAVPDAHELPSANTEELGPMSKAHVVVTGAWNKLLL